MMILTSRQEVVANSRFDTEIFDTNTGIMYTLSEPVGKEPELWIGIVGGLEDTGYTYHGQVALDLWNMIKANATPAMPV